MTTQTTPGPWRPSIPPRGSKRTTIYAHGNIPVAEVLAPGLRYDQRGSGPAYAHEYQANIQLIAQAPTMRDALRLIVDADVAAISNEVQARRAISDMQDVARDALDGTAAPSDIWSVADVRRHLDETGLPQPAVPTMRALLDEGQALADRAAEAWETGDLAACVRELEDWARRVREGGR